ncbi:MAG: hypothetical protein GVY29_08400 [Spirochaetes bacterium]|nr:hypothetical protein [Spirochaetota bacterium]
MSASPAYVAARRPTTVSIARLTNFYPLYDAANDQVDRIVPVRRTIFQRIIPRYELSTSETRDQGLGPAFIEIPSFSYSIGEPQASTRPTTAATAAAPGAIPSRPSPLPDGVGRRIDLWA